MKKEKINIEQIIEDLEIEKFDFPKYVTQIINLANQNAQGTRPKVVGQLSDLINQIDEKTYKKWKEFYLKNYGDKIDVTTDKIWQMINNLKEAIDKIDKNMIKNWVYDLIINKTAEGLIIQEFILKYLAKKYNKSYKLADANEESQNIDGFIGNIPVQIKSDTYKTKTNVKNENIKVPIIFYKKTDKYITIEYNEKDFI
jgi:hypothetical protein